MLDDFWDRIQTNMNRSSSGQLRQAQSPGCKPCRMVLDKRAGTKYQQREGVRDLRNPLNFLVARENERVYVEQMLDGILDSL